MKYATYIILLFIVFGCAIQESVYVKDGKEYGVTNGLFRGKWWNYYERGFSYAEGGYYEEAASDFLAAIEKRSEDKWRSRTYGMHVVKYFPHRELGTVYYKLKKYNDARDELERSLSTAESAKAKHYLNKTRKAILEQTGDDKLPPSIMINYPLDETVTNKFTLALSGEAADDYFVSSVFVNSIPLPLELSSKTVLLKKDIELKRGINEIKVMASDLTGKRTEKSLIINVDRDGPVIIIEEQQIIGQKMIVSGNLYDSSGFSAFVFNGKHLPVDINNGGGTLGRELEFREEINLPLGSDTVIFKAEDTVGNVTRGEIKVTEELTMLDGLPLLAFSGNSIGKIFDDQSPSIYLKNVTDSQTSYSDSLYIEGSASDNSRIVSILINQEEILNRTGKRVFFNYLAGLKEGWNRFVIQITDSYGNKTEKIIDVNRKIPKVRQVGSRMSISVLPFELKGKGSIYSEAVYESLISAFVNQRRFHLIEREKIEEVLRELKLNQTDLIDPDTASRIGKIVAADSILTGTVYENENSIEVFTRLVDTETSFIMEAKDVFNEGRSFGGIKKIMAGLALKYKVSFPLLEGIVIKKDGETLLTDLSEGMNIRRNMGLILYREGEDISHPISGAMLGAEPEEIGEAKIMDVYKEFSKAVIIKGEPAEIKVRDKIITK